MDGGKAVSCVRPVRAGVPLTGRSHLHDIYDKSGRSGCMIFMVSRMQISDAAGEHIDTVFRATLIADQPCSLSAVVTDIDEDSGLVQLDVAVRNEAGETRVFGTANVRLPTA